MINVINLSGKEIDFDAAVQHMDDEIREDLHMEIAPCTEQDFFTAYENEHIKRHGEQWFLSETNPTR